MTECDPLRSSSRSFRNQPTCIKRLPARFNEIVSETKSENRVAEALCTARRLKKPRRTSAAGAPPALRSLGRERLGRCSSGCARNAFVSVRQDLAEIEAEADQDAVAGRLGLDMRDVAADRRRAAAADIVRQRHVLG